MVSTVGAQMSDRKLQAAIFDNSWTLTEGCFGVTDVLVLSQDSDQEALLQYAASVDAICEPPIAKAIWESSCQTLAIEGFQTSRGKSVEGRVASTSAKLVRLGFLREQSIDVDDARVEPLLAQGKTVVFVLLNGGLKGAIALAEIARPEATPAIWSEVRRSTRDC